DRLDRLSERIACCPAIDAGDSVPGRDRLAVVEFHLAAQAEGPGEAVARNLFRFDHLALDLQTCVHPVKRIPYQEASVAGDVSGGPDRIKVGEVGVRHQAHGARCGALRDGWGDQSTCRGYGTSTSKGFQKCAPIHCISPILPGDVCQTLTFCDRLVRNKKWPTSRGSLSKLGQTEKFGHPWDTLVRPPAADIVTLHV